MPRSQVDAFAMEAGEVFGFFDRDYNGKVASHELIALLNSMGQYPTEQECQKLLKDVQGGKDFTLKQFLAMLKAYDQRSKQWEHELQRAFSAFDKRGDGSISARELQHAVCSLGNKLQPGVAKSFIRQADVHRTGFINFEEFRRLLSAGRHS
eukprot:m.111924 g.111924  ORF g.111924 m.111924 type:complete len:152 (-) comp17017_c0_seq1:183-638(-)